MAGGARPPPARRQGLLCDDRRRHADRGGVQLRPYRPDQGPVLDRGHQRGHAVPLMVVMMVMTRQRRVMGQFTLPRWLHVIGWVSTAAMTLAVVTMFATWKS